MDIKKKKALKYAAKKLLRPGVISVTFLIIAIAAACASAFFGENLGHEDYVISTIFLTLATGLAIAGIAVGGYNEIFCCRAIRSCTFYKETRTFALPLISAISALVIVTLFTLLNVITASCGFIAAERLPDSIIACAVGAGLSLLGGGHLGFMIASPFAFFGTFSFTTIFAPGFLINGFGLDLVQGILVAAAIIIVSSIAGFAVSRIAYKKRNTAYIDSVTKAYASNGQLK